MGMYNSIYADLKCPATGQSVRSQIQIKWQERESRLLERYGVGSHLPGLPPGYRNAWIRDDYTCGWDEDDAGDGPAGCCGRDHFAFVKLEEGHIREILDQEAFEKGGVVFLEHGQAAKDWEIGD